MLTALLFVPNPQARRLFLPGRALSQIPVGMALRQAFYDFIGRIGLVQMQSVNTVTRTCHTFLWSRRQSFTPVALK